MNDREVDFTPTNRFQFGENWDRFLSLLNEDRIAIAQESLKQMLEVEDLSGKTFLDVGCGSGLFSLAAMRLGASHVRSFDFDPTSVACAERLRDLYAIASERWLTQRGSILNEDYVKSLGTFDIVYSWGVLHHTGDMWRALDLVTLPVKRPGGRLFIAIYNHARFSQIWLRVKKIYCTLPGFLRTPYVLMFLPPMELLMMAGNVFRGNSPLSHWTTYRKNRGMSHWYDVRDWIGGYPYEYAKPELIFDFYRKKGFRLDRLALDGGHGCNQFVFTAED